MSSWDVNYSKIRIVEVNLQDKLQQLSDYGRMIQKDNSHIEQTMDDYTNIKDDITNLFRNYRTYLENMENIANSTSNYKYQSIINRQKDVLHDLKREYKKYSESIQQYQDRFALFHSHSSHESVEDDDMQYLLKERNSTQTAIHMADEYLNQASTSHQTLLSQRNTLSSSHNKMMAVINRVPGVNSLIKNIQNKSSKDNLILAVFIALCICFCIWYVWK